MPCITADALRKSIDGIVDNENSKLHTDELAAYKTIGRTFGQGHDIVNHKQHEYAKGEAGINTAESFFAILKRGRYGTFHLLSENHLHRYCDEFAFRWKFRKVSDGERLVQTIKRVGGKRLTYRGPVMSKKPAKKPATGTKPESYAPPLAIPLPLDKLVEGLLKVDPKKLPSKRAKAAPGDPLPEAAPAGQRKVVTDKTGAKNRKKAKGTE
jgi:hypothetical protein